MWLAQLGLMVIMFDDQVLLTCIFSLLTFFFSLWDIDLEFKLVFLAKHGLYMEKATILPLSSVIFLSFFFHFLYPAYFV